MSHASYFHLEQAVKEKVAEERKLDVSMQRFADEFESSLISLLSAPPNTVCMGSVDEDGAFRQKVAGRVGCRLDRAVSVVFADELKFAPVVVELHFAEQNGKMRAAIHGELAQAIDYDPVIDVAALHQFVQTVIVKIQRLIEDRYL